MNIYPILLSKILICIFFTNNILFKISEEYIEIFDVENLNHLYTPVDFINQLNTSRHVEMGTITIDIRENVKYEKLCLYIDKTQMIELDHFNYENSNEEALAVSVELSKYVLYDNQRVINLLKCVIFMFIVCLLSLICSKMYAPGF